MKGNNKEEEGRGGGLRGEKRGVQSWWGGGQEDMIGVAVTLRNVHGGAEGGGYQAYEDNTCYFATIWLHGRL